jgi:N-acetylglucosaminyldiphosphoundecaprenol N-acetyl-beta-D-mannosaminyltransferase
MIQILIVETILNLFGGNFGELMTPSYTQVDLFGVSLSKFNVMEIKNLVRSSKESSTTQIIAGHNMHSLFLTTKNKSFLNFYESASIVIPDGFPIALLASIRSFSCFKRVSSTDWLESLFFEDEQVRVAAVGADFVSNVAFISFLKTNANVHVVRGWHGESWSDSRATTVLEELESFQPDVTLIALGMPLQESFALKVFGVQKRGTIATVGGAFDQMTGFQSRAPKQLGMLGLEWLWRLATQPKRLWKRYLIEPWKIFLFAIKGGFKD